MWKEIMRLFPLLIPWSPFLLELSMPEEGENCRPMQQTASKLPSTLHISFALEKRFGSSVLEWQPLPPSQLHPGPAGQLPKIKVSAAPGQSLGGVSI